jgi:dihydroxy-acid dehydratase
VDLVRQGVTARQIMTREAFLNAITVDMALGGSTNTCLHIPAVAYEAGVEVSLDDFDEVSRGVPHISNLRPGGDFFMEDLWHAGGIPAVFKRLKDHVRKCNTTSGVDTHEIADQAEVFDEDVIRPVANPYHKEGGIAVLKGNLAEDGSVIKQTALKPDMQRFVGKARVFDSEEAAMKAIMDRAIEAGSIIVIRSCSNVEMVVGLALGGVSCFFRQ